MKIIFYVQANEQLLTQRLPDERWVRHAALRLQYYASLEPYLKDLSESTGFKPLFSQDQLEKSPGTIDAYLSCLEYLVEELFNPKIPFLPEPASERACQYCPFTLACKK